MTSLQKATLWVIGCLLLVFALSLGLAWYQFGYLDWPATAKMGLLLLPILVAAAVVMLRQDKPEKRDVTVAVPREAERLAKRTHRQETPAVSEVANAHAGRE